MPDGKLGASDDDDDPFEGVELAADAPEPTQEEMDEWATLDTPDEDASPVASGKVESKPVDTAAPAAALPPEPKRLEAELPVKKKEETTKEAELTGEPGAFNPPASASMPAEPGAQAGDAGETVEPVSVQVAASSLPPAVAPAPTPLDIGLSEITPSMSPGPATSSELDTKALTAAKAKDQLLDEEDFTDPHGDQPRQQQHSGGGWGTGWGAGWGLGALSGKLREVAAGAVRDVKDLTETFQAALADVTGAEDEEERARLISQMDRAAEEAADDDEGELDPDGAQAPGGGIIAAQALDAPRQAAEPVREGRHHHGGSRRSAGGSAGDAAGEVPVPPPPRDPALEAGLQAIDAQVEQLATGAARALTSLWGGLSSVAKVVAAEVAASVADVQSSEAVRGVAQIGTKIAHTAERGLETVGRTAMVLLEEVAGVGGGHTGRRRLWGEEADARAADMGREPSTFQDFFYIYGGEQLAEEVNNLSNECSHLCNKSRSKLEGDQQRALDEALARLGPYFQDLGLEAAAGATPSTPPPLQPPELDDSSREAGERLAQMYEPISYLVQDSMSRSEAYLHQIKEAMDAAAAAASVRQRSPAQRQERSSPSGKRREERQALLKETRETEAEAKAEAEEREELLREQRQQQQEAAADPAALLSSFRSHFTKRLAEVATAQLQLLLNLGASLAAPARTGRPALDGISWPASSEQQAALLAGEARRMVTDLRAVADAYAAALAGLREHVVALAQGKGEGEAEGRGAEGREEGGEAGAEGAAEEEGAEKGGTVVAEGEGALEGLSAALTSSYESASASIKGSYRGLLYAVLLRSLVMQIAQQAEAEEEDEAAEVEKTEEEEVQEGDAAAASSAAQ